MNASNMELGMSANFITKCRRKECGDIDILNKRFGYKLDFCCIQCFFDLSNLVPFRSVVVCVCARVCVCVYVCIYLTSSGARARDPRPREPKGL
jgi:hypothetical protein